MKTIFTGLNLVLLTVALYFCVTIMYGRIETETFSIPERSNPGKKIPESIPQEKPMRPGTLSTAIIQRNLFKAAITPEKAEKLMDIQDETMLAPTTLKLKLWGTVVGTGRQSIAVIQEEKARTQTLFHEGDSVSKALIKKILRSSVVLNYNGEDQILEMEASMPKGHATAIPVPMSSSVNTSTMTIEKSVIDDAINDMETLTKQVRVRPHFSKGKPDGLLIYGIRNNTLFNKLGLKNGDILMGVDNKELNSISDALALYQTLSQASQAKLEIKRRGKTKEIIYNVQQ